MYVWVEVGNEELTP